MMYRRDSTATHYKAKRPKTDSNRHRSFKRDNVSKKSIGMVAMIVVAAGLLYAFVWRDSGRDDVKSKKREHNQSNNELEDVVYRLRIDKSIIPKVD